MYQANKEQLAAFKKDHEYLKTKLDLGKEILWLTKDGCIQADPDTEETLELVRQALLRMARTNMKCLQKSVSTPSMMFSSMQCLHMYPAIWLVA